MSEQPEIPSIFKSLLEAKAKKGVSFEQIGKEIGRDEMWVAALLFGQAKATTQEVQKIANFLGVEQVAVTAEIGDNWFPHRGIGPVPPTDPVIYRLYEAILVYGHPLKAVIHEKFGDGIMSMIDCHVRVERKPDPKGDRVLLTFDGKFLPYAKW